MTNKNLARLSTIAAVVPALLCAYSAHAGPVRYDNGSAVGAAGVWVPQEGPVDIGGQVDLNFGFNFFGGTATHVQVNNFGQLEILGASGGLGLIQVADLLANPEAPALYSLTTGVTDPLPALGGDAVTDGFRVEWFFEDGLQAQISLFALQSGGSIIEFNYLDFLTGNGIDLSSGATALGLITPNSGTGFNLLDYLTAQQPNCLATFGHGQLVGNAGDPTDGCTSYFVDGAFSSLALPTPFDTTNGGADEGPADYRYLLRYGGNVTPPSPVPEPTTLMLLTAGIAALAATRRKRRDH